ncbi:hypothetical protein V866_003730 [Kwoniella sp. B9012]|uniref:SUR7/PalI family-domain-containing protein n=1 Tax=Kwoniella europaea PYCC6329 TaxID=1423913 RepID=A0AAX4KH05_9TREE
MNTSVFFEKRVGWTKYTIILLLLVISFILDIMISIPTLTTTPKLSGIRAISSVQVPSSDRIGMEWVEIGIGIGASEGCMWYGKDNRLCRYTLNFQPSSQFLHLPPNQNVTNHFPVGRIMASAHINTAMQAVVTTSFGLGPFFPRLFPFTIVLLPVTVFMSIFSGICLVIVSAQVGYHLKYSIPKFELEWSINFVLAFGVVFLQLVLSIWVGCLRCKMRKKNPPPPDMTDEVQLEPRPRDNSLG